MKVLIIAVHPNFEESIVNKRWVQELEKHPDKYVVHNLYQLYPDEKIDIRKEQNLIESFDKIVFQFPFYWFSSPPLLKKWLDEVLTHGWAYGKGSDYKLANKRIGLSISAGIDEANYSVAGKYKYTLKELTSPLEITFQYIRANYKSFFAFYGTEHNLTKERIESSIPDYLHFIDSL